ncbi:CHAT domain-containing protein [Anatilimnocola floriformis]|uniref:CHAT domain-containing protein n=1 Tax=Anatilimnocola floriformis TaxID=2948575 RepID=UPI0020C2052E|nr:CHAT domain-containing protein [Anatilimnocola floriformis]
MKCCSYRRLSCILACALVFTAALLAGRTTLAQGMGTRTIPNDSFFMMFGGYYDGDYQSSVRAFRESGRGALASVDGRWVDSCCYHTMVGESLYQMGDLAGALEQHNIACKLFLANRDWMLRAEFPPGVDPENNPRVTITWGAASTRGMKIGKFQERYQVLQGRLDNAAVASQGGVVAPPSLRPVNVIEICRCIALSIRRRGEIMGPTCELDPLTSQLVTELSRLPAAPNHWSQCFVEIQYGLALNAANKPMQAIPALQRGLLAGGVYDHPLSALALIELGKIAFDAEKYDVAYASFLEATYSAAWFDRFDFMEEAFRGAQQTFLISGQQGVFAPAVPAAAWAKQKRLRTMQVTLFTGLAENLAATGDLSGAANTLGLAKSALGRAEAANGTLGSRVNYQAARIALAQGNGRGGGESLIAALNYQKKASHGLFQIALADNMFLNGNVTERLADALYATVLREPRPRDWKLDPLEVMAIQSVPHPLPMEHWFELALARKEPEKALEIADRIRRHRFHATLPLGGRLLALRWVLQAPKELLDDAAVLQKQDLLNRFGPYADLNTQAAAARAALEQLPLVPPDDAGKKQVAELYQKLGTTSSGQEALLNQIALARVAADQPFPPLRTVKEMQSGIKEGSLVLAFFQTSRNLHAFAFTSSQYVYFTLDAPKLRVELVDMLKKLGLHDRNQPVSIEDLQSEAWKTPAASILKKLSNNARPEDWAKYKELIIVPDSFLWYVPFEALPMPGSADGAPLITQLNIRYAPTMSLVGGDKRPAKPLSRTAIIAGKMLPRDDEGLAKGVADQLAGALPGSTVLQETMPAPGGLLGTQFDRLVMLTDMEDGDKLPFGWSPLQLDKGKPGGSLSDWMMLPWGCPEQLVLPTFHTATEYGLKKGGTGEEMFMSICGLMASGGRSILLSRWRVGGRTTGDFVREYAQELPHLQPSAAQRRSITLLRGTSLDPREEVRLRAPATLDEFKPEHPFFWGGYMLVDSSAYQPREKAKAE